MLKTPLYEKHLAQNAKMVEFAGWSMPIQYTSIIEEHTAVRKAVGMFDVSHMGDLFISGSGAAAFLNKVQTANIEKLKVGRMKYNHVLNERGIIIDDIIVGKMKDDEYLAVVNAATTKTILDWFMKHLAGDAKIRNASDEYGCIALQGPLAQNTLQKLTNYDLKQIKFFGFDHIDLGDRAIVSRTGYTGEDGFEIIANNKAIADIWDELLEAGKEFGIKPAGLGARDTLRLEKGFLLSGQDFHMDRTPIEANIEWVVQWEHEFIGKEALLKQKEDPKRDKFVGLEMTGRGIPRTGYPILKDGKQIGKATSGTMAPTLKKGIALGYVPLAHSAIGTELSVEIRGEPVAAKVVEVPFK